MGEGSITARPQAVSSQQFGLDRAGPRRGRRPRTGLGRLMAGRTPVPGAAALDRRPSALVWIDSREATVACWEAGAVRVERLRSDVPTHRRSTGHVRHDPHVRHGGGGAPQTAGEPRRLEHLARFLHAVEQRLPPTADLVLLGPGTVHERLAREIRDHDAHHRIDRSVWSDVAPRLTRGQLVARLRIASGDQPRRRPVGAFSVDRSRVVARRSRPSVPRPPRGVT